MAIRTADLKTRLNTQLETLTTAGAAAAGGTGTGDDINAYAKALKIVNDNSSFIDGLATSNVAYDLVTDLYYGHSEDNNSGTNVTLNDGTTTAVVAGSNRANGFNALFLSNGIDQLRQVYAQATTLASIDYKLTTGVGSSNLTIALKNDLGNDPSAARSVQFVFRDGTAITSGVSNTGTAEAATSVVVPSGSTLGQTDGVEATFYIYAINNDGTVELGVTGGAKLDEGILHSSTAIGSGGPHTAATTLFSTTARSNKPVRLIGKLRHTQSTAGTYASAGTELTLADHIDTGRSKLAANERIEWQDSNQYIEGTTTGITIEADDNFVVNTDTLAQLNSTTKVDLVAPTTNVVATTAFDANTPSFIIRSSTAQKPVVDIQNDGNDATGPVLRLINNRSGDGADNDEAGRIEFHSKDDGTPTDFITAQMFSNVADATSSSKDGVWSLQVMSNQSLTNRLVANSSGVGVTGTLVVSGDLTVSGTTTTVDSTVTTYVDPMIELQTAVGGGAPGTETTKDVGLLMNYHNGSAAKQAFAGFDDDLEKFVFIADATESGTQVISGTAGTIHANFTVPNDGTIGSTGDSDAIAISSAGVVTFSQSPVIGGTTPKLTIGDAGAEDTMLVFDGNATDVRLGIRDSTDLFEIGTGTTHGTTPAITINTSQVVNFPNNPQFGGTAIGATAAELNKLDGSAKSTSSITIADSDAFIVIDGTTTTQIPASDIKTYAAFSGALTSDLTVFDDQNNADASISLGTSATEALVISVLNGASNKTAESVSFTSKTASSTANTGMMTFSVDEATAQLTIHDGGINATTISETSSRELKTNITPMSNSLDKIMALQGVNFDWKDGKGGKQIGLIADDVANVVPEVVQFNETSPTSLQYSKMVALLIEGMKEQQNEIAELKKLVSKSK